ncbi:MAG: hypothetical protein JWM18_556, partial [Chloroflexi bacterium]|nr:hypothetical protein [Chloroflexota bacterium]
ARRARRAGVRCVALAGGLGEGVPPLFDRVVELGTGLPVAERIAGAARLLEDAAAALVRSQ